MYFVISPNYQLRPFKILRQGGSTLFFPPPTGHIVRALSNTYLKRVKTTVCPRRTGPRVSQGVRFGPAGLSTPPAEPPITDDFKTMLLPLACNAMILPNHREGSRPLGSRICTFVYAGYCKVYWHLVLKGFKLHCE